MKVALILYGQPRSYLKGHDHIKKFILESYDVDVYFHTYWSEHERSYSKSPWSNADVAVEKNTKEHLLLLYNPVKWIIEASRDFKDVSLPDSIKKTRNYTNYVSQLYSIHQAFSLLKYRNVNSYDCVIKLRFDYFFTHDQTNSVFPDLHSLEKGKMYVHGCHITRSDVFNDNVWIIVAPTEQLLNIGNIFPNIERYFKEINTLNVEAMLAHHCKKIGIWDLIEELPVHIFD